MGSEGPVPAMISFGNPGCLRSFQLCEVQGSSLLGDLMSQFAPDGWAGGSGGEQSSICVKISSTKSGGFDKFSLMNSVSLVMRVLKSDVLWITFEKNVSKPVDVPNAFAILREAQANKALPRKIEKPFNQKQVLFNSLLDAFEHKGVKFSSSECYPRMKHKPTGSATQLLYDITDTVWKLGHCRTQLVGRSLWKKVPQELQNLMTFEVKSKDLVQMNQNSTKMFATNIREIADRAVMAQVKLYSLRIALFQAAEVMLEYSSWLEKHSQSVRNVLASKKLIGTASEAIIKQVGDREKIMLVEKGKKPPTHPVAIEIFDELEKVPQYQPVNISVFLPTNRFTRSSILHRTIPSQAPEKFVI